MTTQPRKAACLSLWPPAACWTEHVEKLARRSPTPRGIKRVTLVIHGKEDGRGTTAFVRECEEIGQIKPRMIEK